MSELKKQNGRVRRTVECTLEIQAHIHSLLRQAEALTTLCQASSSKGKKEKLREIRVEP